MRRRASLLAMLAAGLLAPAGAGATGYLAYELGKSCLACHTDSRGKTGLTERGREAYEAGYRFARDPRLTVHQPWRPLSKGGVRMLERRYRVLGRRLFRMSEVGRGGRSCLDCHAAGSGIEDAFLTYPKQRGAEGEWWTLEQAVNDCLVERMGTRPLIHGSRTSVAIQMYLRDMEVADHDTRALTSRLARSSDDEPIPRGGRPRREDGSSYLPTRSSHGLSAEAAPTGSRPGRGGPSSGPGRGEEPCGCDAGGGPDPHRVEVEDPFGPGGSFRPRPLGGGR